MDPFSFLYSLQKLGMKFGLENISRLCRALGHPERAFRPVLIAGTNGKGSVTAMTESALRAAGHHVARYTSPHLVRLEERFVIGGREVATADLGSALGRVQEMTNELIARGTLEGPPTFFECATAAAFVLFRRAGVDIAVLEVGLGGRLDATNVVSPIATAITSIDFDHQAQLGNTLRAIAREKAGIIRPGVPVVCGPLAPEAEEAVGSAACAAGARMVRALDAVSVTRRADRSSDFRSTEYSLDAVQLALPGGHQAHNAAVALAVLAELERLGVRCGAQAARRGLETVSWPGRLEHVRRGETEILFDAAHNPAGAAALCEYLREIGWTRSVLVFGAMRDKDVAAMLAALAPVCCRIVCTAAATPRAMPASEIARVAAQVGRWIVAVEGDPAAALRLAQRDGVRVVVAGSIFLVGPLRDILR